MLDELLQMMRELIEEIRLLRLVTERGTQHPAE